MAVLTRPYYLVFKGEPFIIESSNPAAAVRHVVGADVTDLRPARGAEITAWTRAGKDIPIVGATPRVATPAPAVSERVEPLEPGQDVEMAPPFTAADAQAWLLEHGMKSAMVATWRRVVEEERMTIDEFDALRVAVPDLTTALIDTILQVPTQEGAAMDSAHVATIRSQMEAEPFPLIVVIGSIAEAKRRELWEAEMVPLEVPAGGSVTAAAADDSVTWPADGSEAEFK